MRKFELAHLKKPSIYVPLILSFLTLLGFLPYFLNFDRNVENDWDYFNSLALVFRSIPLHYKSFPLHDPWVCGGTDILANPQSWIFSPSYLLTLLIPSPYLSNLVSLLLFSLAGLWAAYKFFSHFGISPWPAWCASFLFVNSSWFGMHFLAGHLVYRSFLLFPLMIFFLLSFQGLRSLFKISALLGFFLLDGGIYPAFFTVIFTLIYFLILLIRRTLRPSHILRFFQQSWAGILGIAVAFALLISPKVVPVLMTFSQRKNHIENYNMTLKELAAAFIFPFQKYRELFFKSHFHWHEFSCYVGVLALLLVVFLFFRRPSLLRERANELVIIFFFLWMGSGWLTPWNPYNLYQKIPLLQQAHVQSRFFLISYLFFLVLLGLSLDDFKKKWKGMEPSSLLLSGLALLLMGESLFVRLYTSQDAFKRNSYPVTYPPIITKNFHSTYDYIPIPDVYFRPFTASRICPKEPAQPLAQVQPRESPFYMGEVFYYDDILAIMPFFVPKSPAKLESFTPGKIKINFPKGPLKLAPLIVNTNFNLGWKAAPPFKAIRHLKNLIMVFWESENPPDSSHGLYLEYDPPYFPWILFSFILGVLSFFLLGWRIWKRKGPV